MATPTESRLLDATTAPFNDESLLLDKKGKRKAQFRPEHSLQFGVRPMSDPPVLKVQCLFCVHFGREILQPEKRLREATKNIKYWRPPYRAELYHKHHQRQHLTLYTTYERLAHREKLAFFSPENVARLRQTAAAGQGHKQTLIKAPTSAATWKQLFEVPLPYNLHSLVDMYSAQATSAAPLDTRTQALCMIAMLLAQPQANAALLEMQLVAAIASEVPRSDILHLIFTAAPVVGMPAMLAALEVAHKVFNTPESDEEEAGDGSETPTDLQV
ncbi:hypothetical protein THRCLA_00148 [Thraustotheca clavata]|uniref:Carboxymuconolactone decarboxylase-like domain-containing protein n=1 Tax=Thraustotheca clavata TaxID=74557 RepID=A0A1W0AC48_9STRA|nr:hypothetical protein THRCLA_00148 [Thraustotheca clavata]